MLLFSLPDISAHESDMNDQNIRSLREVLISQRETMKELMTIMNYLQGLQNGGLDDQDKLKYTHKISRITDRQERHFVKIDAMINENILAIKKGKTADNNVLRFGKEVRKLEAGVRTLRLFVGDVIEMTQLTAIERQQVKDRIAYFDTRSTALEFEIAQLLKIMPA